MLSIGKVSSGSADYYTKDNYYAPLKGEVAVPNSHWQGSGAKELGLAGAIEAETFADIMDGKLPDGTVLGRMAQGERQHVPGWDLTFSAPKGVSILIEVLGDKAASEAFDSAIGNTAKAIEREALQTRVWDKQAQRQKTKTAPGMVAALFRHDVSRNHDPDTHTHMIVANAVQSDDGKWRSVHSKPLYERKLEFGARMRADLAYQLKQKGFGIEARPQGFFGIVGISKTLETHFSTRRAEIEKSLEERGASGGAAAARAALFTRSASKAVSRKTLEANWQGTLAKLDTSAIDLKRRVTQNGPAPQAKPANKILADAIDHTSERAAAFSETALKTTLYQFGTGHASPDQMDKAYSYAIKTGRLIRGSGNYTGLVTTRCAIKLETDTIDEMKVGQLAVNPLHTASSIAERANAASLADDQTRALHLIVGGVHRIVGIQGRAGTGKTTMLSAARQLLEEGGVQAIGLAPSGMAVKALSEAIPAAETLQGFLLKHANAAPDLKGKALFVDEASMISTRQMHKLLKIANRGQAERLVLIGDTQQLKSVERGAPFAALQANDLPMAKMDVIKRQNSERHKASVHALSVGDIDTAFSALAPDITEVAPGDIAEATASAFLNLSRAERGHAKVMSPTHSMNRSITAHIREGLKASGELGSKVLTMRRLTPKNLTLSERGAPASFSIGGHVMFRSGAPDRGIGREETFEIKSQNSNGNFILQSERQMLSWRPNEKDAPHIEYFESYEIELAKGDRLRATRGGMRARMINNTRSQVTDVSDTHVTLKTAEGEVLKLGLNDPALRHIDHAWSSTIHAMQGQTTRHAIVAMRAGPTPLTNQQTAYVAVSRGAETISLITDDREELASTLKLQTGVAKSALGVLQSSDKASDRETDEAPQEPVIERSFDRGR